MECTAAIYCQVRRSTASTVNCGNVCRASIAGYAIKDTSGRTATRQEKGDACAAPMVLPKNVIRVHTCLTLTVSPATKTMKPPTCFDQCLILVSGGSTKRAHSEVLHAANPARTQCLRTQSFLAALILNTQLRHVPGNALLGTLRMGVNAIGAFLRRIMPIM